MTQAQQQLQHLEDESIFIIRETVAECERPVLLYSIGKDSSVLLHLARKAFYPAKIPFPLLHVDTTWKFREMIEFREQTVRQHQLDLIVHINKTGVADGVNPFTYDSQVYTDIMKTQSLLQALNKYGFDAAFGGARRDEEKSRAKERVMSFRNKNHQWDPKNQRPELWHLYNCRLKKDESLRVFPLSNWTELDVWQYIEQQQIPVVPLYFSKKRSYVDRDGVKILIDDDRIKLQSGEVINRDYIRFRTLGCYPLTGAILSRATTLSEIIQETITAKYSERQGRMIDHDQRGSMELKKRQGYF